MVTATGDGKATAMDWTARAMDWMARVMDWTMAVIVTSQGGKGLSLSSVKATKG
jgi:hypothetical protein